MSTTTPTSPTTKFRVVQIYDYQYPPLWQPLRVSRTVTYTPADLGLEPWADRNLIAKKVGERLSKEATQYPMARCYLASAAYGADYQGHYSPLDMSDVAAVRNGPYDLRCLRIRPVAWRMFCRSRSPLGADLHDLTEEQATGLFKKLLGLLERVKPVWCGRVSHYSCPHLMDQGLVCQDTPKMIFTADDPRHIMITDGIGLLYYAFEPTREDALDHAAGLIKALGKHHNHTSWDPGMAERVFTKKKAEEVADSAPTLQHA